MSQLIIDMEDEVEKKYKLLKEKALFMPGVLDEFDVSTVPHWFDEKKFKKCIYLADKYFVSLFMSHLIGLLLVIQIPSGLSPLLATGNSSSVPKLYRRYLSTLIHLKNWYESNPFQPQSNSWKSIKQVRSMHKRVAQMMNQKYIREENEDKIWLSQFDFVMTQWAFIGPLILWPQHCGFHSRNSEDIDHLIYLWRVIAYSNGIHEDFNLCSSNSIEEIKLLTKTLFERDFLPNIADQNNCLTKLGNSMGQGITLAMRMINSSCNWQAICKYWYEKIGLENHLKANDIKLDTFLSKISYILITFHFQYALRLSVFHWIYSYFYKLLLNWSVKKRNIREKVLNKKYPDLKYEPVCPLMIDLDYSDVFGNKIKDVQEREIEITAL